MDLRRQQTFSDEPIKGAAQMRRMALVRSRRSNVSTWPMPRSCCRSASSLAPPDALVERYEQNNVWCWRFKPMAELLLLELTGLADADDLSPDERRERIEWAIEMSGF